MKTIAFTFDDGPAPETTPKLLAALAAAGAKATFMLWGEHVQQHPDLVRQIHDAGHELGNHTFTHQSLPGLSKAAIQAEITQTQRAIQAASGVAPAFFRPPYGDIDPDSLASAGLPAVTWHVDSQDWKTHDAAQTVKRVTALAQPGDIVLMHDGLASTTEALPELLATFASQGYTFVPVTALFTQPLAPGAVYRASTLVEDI